MDTGRTTKHSGVQMWLHSQKGNLYPTDTCSQYSTHSPTHFPVAPTPEAQVCLVQLSSPRAALASVPKLLPSSQPPRLGRQHDREQAANAPCHPLTVINCAG
ncbi:hypothetical protein C0Q70_02803 [Pomacea canaliculata]|uniref:Uncharacterized protein n=1 Tax=Pomacea canaliculata TaxID=400727 RepID=A0A2T7PQY2_POMCA|nr:hypothetical protein C0Q70_02803 [Pomacea canaliculata]